MGPSHAESSQAADRARARAIPGRRPRWMRWRMRMRRTGAGQSGAGRWMRSAAVLAAATLTLAACGGGDGSDGGGGGGSAEGEETTFVFGGSADPVILDGSYVSDGESIRVIRQIFEG